MSYCLTDAAKARAIARLVDAGILVPQYIEIQWPFTVVRADWWDTVEWWDEVNQYQDAMLVVDESQLVGREVVVRVEHPISDTPESTTTQASKQSRTSFDNAPSEAPSLATTTAVEQISTVGHVILKAMAKNQTTTYECKKIGRDIAIDAKRTYDSYFRVAMKELRQRGYVQSPGRGYYLTAKGIEYACPKKS